MMPHTIQNNQSPFRIKDSSVIGLPSPKALRREQFPGVMIGSDPEIGMHCIIYGNVFIGNRFRCGTDVLIRENVAIGDQVTIGTGVCIDTGVSVADNVTIGENVWIPPTTKIGRDVTISSHVKFLNDLPDGKITARRSRGIILEHGCMIGENAVIGPGICIGAGAHVKPYSQVTEDVPPDLTRVLGS
jgi:UDP-3-O-[3-hydroxymyristoyl] glucosamine N-acyltransferase